MARFAGNGHRIFHAPVQGPVSHHIPAPMAVHAMHAELMMYIRRGQGIVVHIERPVQAHIRGALDVRAACAVGRQLGQASKLQSNRCVPVVTGHAGLSAGGGGHHVSARVTRLSFRNGPIR